MSTDPSPLHPVQPIVTDKEGIRRFRGNKIVRHLVDRGDMTLNRLNTMTFPMEDWQQFMQLIGTSLGGYADSPHVTNAAYARAILVNDPTRELNSPLDARYVLNTVSDAAWYIQRSVDACAKCRGVGILRSLGKGAHCPDCAGMRSCLERLREILPQDKPGPRYVVVDLPAIAFPGYTAEVLDTKIHKAICRCGEKFDADLIAAEMNAATAPREG